MREMVIQPRCFHSVSLSSLLPPCPPTTFRLSVLIKSGKRRMFKNLAITRGLINAITEFPGLGTGFVHLGTTDVWGWIVLYCRECPLHCGILTSVPGLHDIVANWVIAALMSPDIVKCPWGVESPQLRTNGVGHKD